MKTQTKLLITIKFWSFEKGQIKQVSDHMRVVSRGFEYDKFRISPKACSLELAVDMSSYPELVEQTTKYLIGEIGRALSAKAESLDIEVSNNVICK